MKIREDGGRKILQNFGIRLQGYIVSQPRRPSDICQQALKNIIDHSPEVS
jgi:hypothetical protein